MTAEAGGILDIRNTTGVPIFDGTDANWESWRVKFEAYADLANMEARLTHGGLDANSVTISKTVRALLITTCEGQALTLVSLVPRRFGLEAWRLLKEKNEGKGGNRTASLPRGVLNPRAEKVYCEGRP